MSVGSAAVAALRREFTKMADGRLFERILRPVPDDLAYERGAVVFRAGVELRVEGGRRLCGISRSGTSGARVPANPRAS